MVAVLLLLLLVLQLQLTNSRMLHRVNFIRPLATVLGSMSLVGVASVRGADDSLSFQNYLNELSDGNIKQVTFVGIRPTYLIAVDKDGKKYIVRDGFPSFDDPLSPSGPAQAIAACQHTPGVVCMQDISEAMKLSRTGRTGIAQPLLSSSSYPAEFLKNVIK